MHEITCPHCGKAFKIDEAGYADILKQVRDREFESALHERLEMAEKAKRTEIELAEAKVAAKLETQLAVKAGEIELLKASIQNTQQVSEQAKQLAVQNAVGAVERERDEFKSGLERSQLEKKLAEQSLKDKYETQIKDRDDAIERLRDMKARLSTKMVGETLEQHCETEFNRIRATAFPRAYFEKDNDARLGSKGDFVFRDFDGGGSGSGGGDSEAGTEIVSIMFEMKNENDETATKKKNEDFFKELDKDGPRKGLNALPLRIGGMARSSLFSPSRPLEVPDFACFGESEALTGVAGSEFHRHQRSWGGSQLRVPHVSDEPT